MKLFSPKFKNSSINTYKGIEDCPLYNFHKYFENKDPNWFIVGYNGTQKPLDFTLLQDAENTIMDEYFLAIDDRSFQLRLQNWYKISNLETRYNIVSSLIYTMRVGFQPTEEDQSMRFRFIKKLAEFGYKMPEINTFGGDLVELDRIDQEKEAIKNKIALIQNELEQNKETTKQNLQKDLLIATKTLDLKFMLNAKELTVAEWIEICNQLKEIAKNN